MLRRHDTRRSATTILEAAIILPVTLFLLVGFVVGAMGVFRYQEVASLAREGARYASTHGAQYRSDAGQAIGTADVWTQDIIDNGITPKRVALDPTRLTVTCAWPPVVNQPDKPDNWPGSKVTVTVSYRWIPEKYLVGPITLTSTAQLPITN
jgi:Flp pilus assembly protein TadG